MNTNPHIETIIAFITSQMDGDQVPPHNSAAIAQLKTAIEGLHKSDKDKDWTVLGLRALGAVIARAGSACQAEETLHKFIRRDGRV
ncbi:MAG: hypothetical protein IPG23_08600 [Burkholderiales bacterium]|jgi:hypothetical protein|nr:hypothetical protein [Burkholderiales bacterium]